MSAEQQQPQQVEIRLDDPAGILFLLRNRLDEARQERGRFAHLAKEPTWAPARVNGALFDVLTVMLRTLEMLLAGITCQVRIMANQLPEGRLVYENALAPGLRAMARARVDYQRQRAAATHHPTPAYTAAFESMQSVLEASEAALLGVAWVIEQYARKQQELREQAESRIVRPAQQRGVIQMPRGKHR